MPIIHISGERNVGDCVDDINENFKYLDEKKSDCYFEYIQSTAAKVWVIEHGMGRPPSVTVIDDSGCLCVGDIEYTDENTLTLRFSEATSGKAYLN